MFLYSKFGFSLNVESCSFCGLGKEPPLPVCLQFLWYKAFFILHKGDYTVKVGIKHRTACCRVRPQGYKTFFMFNSFEHKILNANKMTK